MILFCLTVLLLNYNYWLILMIPKILHLCWLSDDPFPPLVEKCVQTWKSILHDYEIMLWNRDRFDIASVPWVSEAFSKKKYAFAADYIRFYALYHYGGIYLDSDVEVLKSFDPLLSKSFFVGKETNGDIEAAVLGAEQGLGWIKQCLDYYNDRHFIMPDGRFDMRPVPLLMNEILEKNSITDVYPSDFFSPKSSTSKKIKLTRNTYCIHHFDGNWIESSFRAALKAKAHDCLISLFGHNLHSKIVNLIRSLK